MSLPLATAALALLAQPAETALSGPGPAPEPEPVIEARAPRVFAPGASAWWTVEVRLDASTGAEAPLRARLLGPSASGAGRLDRFAEVMAVENRRATVRFPVGAGPTGPARGRIRATVVVLPVGGARALGRRSVDVPIQVGERSERPADLDALGRAHDGWVAVARAARAQAGPVAEGVDLVGVGGLPDPEDAQTAEALRRLGRARVEAEAARARLRAEALAHPDPDRQERATAVLARLAIPRGPGPRPGLERTVPSALRGVLLDLAGARLLAARRGLEGLRASGAADEDQLARALVLEGVLAAARGERAGATLVGQARCLRPAVSTEVPLAPLARLTRAARAADPCRGASLGVGAVRAFRVRQEGEPGLRVEAAIAHDPEHLVQRAKVVRLGGGGGEIESREVPVEPGEGIRVVFSGDDALHRPDRIGLQLVLRDRFGTRVAEAGLQEPLIVRLEDGEGLGGFRVPDWVWFTLGGVAVVAAGSALVAVAASGDEVERSVGPVSIGF